MAVEAKVSGGELPGGGELHATLPSRDYYSPEVFELEKERIFYGKWLCVGREEQLPRPGDFMLAQVADESILLVRDGGGGLRGFYNVCRHRGSRLCDDAAGHLGRAIQCPYHAWTYGLDGRLLATPNVGDVEGFDRADYPLHSVHLDTWEGFVFVNLFEEPGALEEFLGPWATAYARYHVGRLRSAYQATDEVTANWKILVENYNECLHCPGVHPELCRLVPLYRRGLVTEDDGSWGNRLADGVETWTMNGRSNRPPLPDLTEEDKRCYYGFHVFPNLFVNLLPDVVATTIMFPLAPDRTRLITDLLFEPSTIARDDFDPSDLVEFRRTVMRQDWDVCERVQMGVRSRAYRSGVYPPQDSCVYEFNQQYLRERGPPRGHETE